VGPSFERLKTRTESSFPPRVGGFLSLSLFLYVEEKVPSQRNFSTPVFRGGLSTHPWRVSHKTSSQPLPQREVSFHPRWHITSACKLTLPTVSQTGGGVVASSYRTGSSDHLGTKGPVPLRSVPRLPGVTFLPK